VGQGNGVKSVESVYYLLITGCGTEFLHFTEQMTSVWDGMDMLHLNIAVSRTWQRSLVHQVSYAGLSESSTQVMASNWLKFICQLCQQWHRDKDKVHLNSDKFRFANWHWVVSVAN